MSARIGKRGNVVLTIFEEDLSIRPAFPLVVDYSMGLIELQGRIAYLILLSGILSDDIDAIKLGANSLKDAIDPVWVRDEYRTLLAFAGYLLDDQSFHRFSNQRIDFILGWKSEADNKDTLNTLGGM